MTDKVHDYHDGNRYYQDKFDTRRLAENSASRSRDEIDDVRHAVFEFAGFSILIQVALAKACSAPSSE